MEELSVASQKAASVANTTGVDMEQFAGHIAAIEATTREAPENIGNGLKTLYSRFADIKLGETLEDGVNLGQFASALKKVGVEVLDNEGKMKDVGVILEDTMDVWQQLDKTQQNALATTVAGRFQLARFEALMNSQDIYKNAVGVARAETGTETYDRMQETYRDSLEGRTKALQASVEEIFLNLFNSNSFNGFIDAAQLLVDTFNDLIESVGGGSNALSGFALIFGQIFNEQMSRGLNNFIQNRELSKAQNQQVQAIQTRAASVYAAGGGQYGNERSQQLDKDIAKAGRYIGSMGNEQREGFYKNVESYAQALSQTEQIEQQLEQKILGTSAALAAQGAEIPKTEEE